MGSQRPLSRGWIGEESESTAQRASIRSEAAPTHRHLVRRKSKGHSCRPLAQASMCNGTCGHACGRHV